MLQICARNAYSLGNMDNLCAVTDMANSPREQNSIYKLSALLGWFAALISLHIMSRTITRTKALLTTQ